MDGGSGSGGGRPDTQDAVALVADLNEAPAPQPKRVPKTRKPNVSNMGPRPINFDLNRARTPKYKEWEALKEGETMVYHNLTYVKGEEGHDEHLLREIFKRGEYDRARKRLNIKLKPNVSNMGPRPINFDLNRARTPKYKEWEALKEGETMVYHKLTYVKGEEGHDEHLLREIFKRGERARACQAQKKKTGKERVPKKKARKVPKKKKLLEQPYLAGDDARPLNPFEMKVARANMLLFGAPAKIEKFHRDSSFDCYNPSPEEIYPQGNYSRIEEMFQD